MKKIKVVAANDSSIFNDYLSMYLQDGWNIEGDLVVAQSSNERTGCIITWSILISKIE